MALPRTLWRDGRATAVGAAAGVAAFLAGAAATFVLQRDELDGSSAVVEEIAALLGPGLADALGSVADWLEPDVVEAVGWFFYASHYVDLEFTASAFGQTLHRTVALQQTPVWDAELAVVPPLALFATGFLLAAADRLRVGRPLEVGVRVALGYAGVALAAVPVATYTRDVGFASVTFGPDAAAAGAFCAAYAVVFAAAGALVHDEYWPESASDQVESAGEN
ncbi:MAG: hypothetical protein ABEH83_03175 [Halobacterium sp.]